MPAGPEPRPAQDVNTGQHLLGPHVVGRRVVVRRLVRGETGPTGGPAFTDLLGVCTAWGARVCVVQPESGPAVTIALADIVSGKPVPPRPSVRMRVSVRDAEAHTARLWPTVAVEPLGEWTLRWETEPQGRLLKRANSCLALGEPGMPVADAAARVAAFYRELGREPLVQVEADSETEAGLAALGWRAVAGGEAAFLLASVAQVRRRMRPVDGLAELVVRDGRATASVGDGGSEWARGTGVLDGDWLGVLALHVDPHHRRQGLAHQVLAALLEWGAEQGARTAWLHVETDNVPALALYESLGFATHHTMRYMRG